MSSKKILRLKTPTKSRIDWGANQPTKVDEFCQQSTILLVKNVACSEELQVTLINEINKLYSEINKLKRSTQESSNRQDQLLKQNRVLKGKIEILEREYRMFKEMYEVERENYERLRKFYEQRQTQWINIVNQHKKILEEYQQFGQNNSKTSSQNPSQFIELQSMYHSFEQMLTKSFVTQQKPCPSPIPKRLSERLRSSLDKQDSLIQPRLKTKISSFKQIHLQRDYSPIKIEEKASLRPRRQLEHPKLNQRIQLGAQKNAQVDEIFDSIVRKTYYRYKEKKVELNQIEQMQDMVKLKNAKTSTKQRLAKTIRKLDFQISNEQELKVLCECVQRAVIDKYKVFRGDYAFQLLVDKMKQCEKLALSSNSELQRLDKEKSGLQGLQNELDAQSKNLYLTSSITDSEVRRVNKDISLLLDSDIKNQIKDTKSEEDLSENIKISDIKFRKSSLGLPQLSALGVQSRYHLKEAVIQ